MMRTHRRNMKKKILGIIITYYPDKQLLLNNVNAIAPHVDKLIIWENTSESKESYRYVSGDNIEYFSEDQNIGISKALNFGWHYAQKEGYDYLLTMDQDSYFDNFVEFCNTCFQYDKEEKCVFGPLITPLKDIRPNNEIFETSINNYLITSGMLIPVSVLDKVGGYNENFMVDVVDLDFNLRVLMKGYKILKNHNGVLVQHFGTPSEKKLFGKTYVCSNYSPFRLYGIFRNHTILYRETKDSFVKNQIKIYFNHYLPRILFWENNKYKKLKAIGKGLLDGIIYKIKKE